MKGDLDLLRSSFLPELTPTIELPGRDYPYRGYCTKEQMSGAMVQLTMSIDYDNFKSTVTKVQGLAREQLYAQVWSVMNNAESKIQKNAHENARWDAKEKAGWFKQQQNEPSTAGNPNWYKKQTTFNYAKGVPANGPVTRIPSDFLHPEDFRDPWDNDDRDPSPLEGVDVDKLSDEELQELLARDQLEFYARDPDAIPDDMPDAPQSDIEFLDSCARDIEAMTADRTAKNGGVSIRKGKNFKKGK